jgi:hypothetical protein
MGSYYVLKGHPASSQRGNILLESSQVRWFLIRSCGGGRSGRNVAQRKPRDLKLGLKGLSDYLSIEMACKAARQGGAQ